MTPREKAVESVVVRWPLWRRIMLKATQAGDCWRWTGYVSRHGYGYLSLRDRPNLAHRASYQAFFGAIPEGLTIDHLCRNRACVNPLHLEAVTMRVNNLRGEGRPARLARQVYCKRGHRLPDKKNARGERICQPCKSAAHKRQYDADPERHREYTRAWRKRKKAAQ